MGDIARASAGIAGLWILVVEDEYIIAMGLALELQERGAEVIGPAPSIEKALHLTRTAPEMDGALLDVNLQGEMAFPVADALLARGVPFIFVTGYGGDMIPARYAEASRCEKPVNSDDIIAALLAAISRRALAGI